MNIIRAIKSGKPFKRKNWDNDFWCILFDGDMKKCIGRLPVFKEMWLEDLIEDDWEIKNDIITISQEQFNKAWKKIVYCHDAEREEMLKELGFEES